MLNQEAEKLHRARTHELEFRLDRVRWELTQQCGRFVLQLHDGQSTPETQALLKELRLEAIALRRAICLEALRRLDELQAEVTASSPADLYSISEIKRLDEDELAELRDLADSTRRAGERPS